MPDLTIGDGSGEFFTYEATIDVVPPRLNGTMGCHDVLPGTQGDGIASR